MSAAAIRAFKAMDLIPLSFFDTFLSHIERKNLMTAYQNFLWKLSKNLENHYHGAYGTVIVRVAENSDATRRAIMVITPDDGFYPVFLMEEAYRQYREGETLAEIFRGLLRRFENRREGDGIARTFFQDPQNVKDRIFYELVGYEANREILSKTPHIRFLDLALACYTTLLQRPGGRLMIPVTATLCHGWGFCEEELFALAEENTPAVLPADVTDIRRILEEAAGVSYKGEGDAYMYLLTNQSGQYGAVCLLYPGVLREFAEKLGRNLYIFPSSVHETLLVPERRELETDGLQRMVCEINRTQVMPEEVLADSVYYYDRENDKILKKY